MTERRTGSGRLPASRVWRWPIVLALLTGVGLAAALLMEGMGDTLGWVALLVPVVVGARALAQCVGGHWRRGYLTSPRGSPGPLSRAAPPPSA
jgi:hypothetical protein